MGLRNKPKRTKRPARGSKQATSPRRKAARENKPSSGSKKPPLFRELFLNSRGNRDKNVQVFAEIISAKQIKRNASMDPHKYVVILDLVNRQGRFQDTIISDRGRVPVKGDVWRFWDDKTDAEGHPVGELVV